jgi:type IV pilus assembly protein PilP
MATINNNLQRLALKGQPGRQVTPFFLSGYGVVCLLLFLTLFADAALAEQKTGSAQGQIAAPVQGDQAATQPTTDQADITKSEGQAAEDIAAIVEENTRVAKALEELLESMKMGDFEYQVEERPDPFMPFISEKVVQSADSESEFGERLTGMRQFEPGQLSLTAIIFTETNPIAMVEDSSHRGYVIRRGTKIGKFGIVADILPNSVIIKQLSYSMSQDQKYTTVEMILRKEGEK